MTSEFMSRPPRINAGTDTRVQSAKHQGHGAQMDQAVHRTTTGEATNHAAVRAFEEAKERVHEDMMMVYSRNADVDLRAMIPHHQGTISMARIVLELGSDLEIRQLAEEIIATQEAKIALLEEWLLALIVRF